MNTYTVWIDWGGNGFAGTDNISAKVRSVRIARGRGNETEPVAQVGKCELTLNNSDGRFSPGLTTSIFYPNVKPMKQVMVTGLDPATGVTYQLFRGFIKRFQPDPSPENQVCYVECVDALEILRLSECRAGPYQDQSIDTLIGNIMDIAASDLYPISKIWLDSGGIVPAWAYWDKENCLEAIAQLCESERGFFYINKGGTCVYESKNHRWGTAHAGAAAYGTAVVIDNNMIGLHYDLDVDSVRNDIGVTVYARSIGAESEVWRDPGTAFITAGGSAVLKSEYNCVVSSTTTPVFGTSTGTVSPGTADLVLNTRESNDGDFVMNGTVAIDAKPHSAVVTISAGTSCYVTTARVRGLPLVLSDGITKNFRGTASGTAYGWRSMPLDLPWRSNQNEAASLGTGLVLRYKDPQPSVSVTIGNNMGTALFNAQLRAELSDPVVTTEPYTGLSSALFYIGGIAHEITEGGAFHTTNWNLENAGTKNVWVVGLGTLGQPATNLYTTAVAY